MDIARKMRQTGTEERKRRKKKGNVDEGQVKTIKVREDNQGNTRRGSEDNQRRGRLWHDLELVHSCHCKTLQ